MTTLLGSLYLLNGSSEKSHFVSYEKLEHIIAREQFLRLVPQFQKYEITVESQQSMQSEA